MSYFHARYTKLMKLLVVTIIVYFLMFQCFMYNPALSCYTQETIFHFSFSFMITIIISMIMIMIIIILYYAKSLHIMQIQIKEHK